MKRSNVVVLGILSIWPLIYIFLAIMFIFSGIINHLSIGSSEEKFLFVSIVHIATILEIFGLMAFYIYWIFKTNLIAGDKKALWAVVLFCANMIAIPVFWYLYFWKVQSTVPQQTAADDAAQREVDQ